MLGVEKVRVLHARARCVHHAIEHDRPREYANHSSTVRAKELGRARLHFRRAAAARKIRNLEAPKPRRHLSGPRIRQASHAAVAAARTRVSGELAAADLPGRKVVSPRVAANEALPNHVDLACRIDGQGAFHGQVQRVERVGSWLGDGDRRAVELHAAHAERRALNENTRVERNDISFQRFPERQARAREGDRGERPARALKATNPEGAVGHLEPLRRREDELRGTHFSPARKAERLDGGEKRQRRVGRDRGLSSHRQPVEAEHPAERGARPRVAEEPGRRGDPVPIHRQDFKGIELTVVDIWVHLETNDVAGEISLQADEEIIAQVGDSARARSREDGPWLALRSSAIFDRELAKSASSNFQEHRARSASGLRNVGRRR